MKEFELEPGEHVVKEARNHWFFFLTEFLPYAIMALFPFAIPKLLVLTPPVADYASYFTYSTPLGHMALALWLLLVWTGAWSVFTRHYLNVWVLTNQRIVAIKQYGYFNREVSSLFLSRIQDVTTNVAGLIPSLLDVGDITVQSAGEVDEFHMDNISRPDQMRDIILKFVSTKSDPTGV